MNESGKKSTSSVDPLLKLKEEREKLIQWSIKLKNNNSSFLCSDKVDEEARERKYSSDDSLEQHEYEIGVERRGMQHNKWKNNEGEEYTNEKGEIEYDTGEKNGINKVRLNIKGNLEDMSKFHLNVQKNKLKNEYPSWEEEEEKGHVLPKLEENKGRQNRFATHGRRSNSSGSDDEKKNSVKLNYIEKYYNKEKNLNNEFKESIISDSSADSIEPNSLHSAMNKRINNVYKNYKPDIHIKESFFKIPTDVNVKDEKIISEKSRNKSNTLSSNSDDTYPNLNTANTKRRIKLTRKVKKNETKNSINNFLNTKVSIWGSKYIPTEQDENSYKNDTIDNHNDSNFNYKSSNESVKTFLPVANQITSRDNFSCTTLHSNNNEIEQNSRRTNGTKLKCKESKKLTSLLEEKVYMLENKKEILNDKIKDLHDNTYTLMDAQERDNLTIQHYEMLIKNLESKYNKLFNMYQELDEHRISYVDAYREKQTKIENLCAIMQIKSEESLKLTQEINILKKRNEEIQGQIYEYIKDIEDKEIVLNKKKEECITLKNSLETANKENTDLHYRLDQVSKELNEALNQNKILQEENDNIKHKYKTMSKSGNSINNFFIPKIENLIDIINKIFQIFKSNDENILTYVNFFKENASLIEEKLSNNDNTCDDIIRLLDTNLLDSLAKVVKQREKEYNEQKEKMKIKFDDQILNMYEMNINNVEVANSYINELKNKLSSVIIQRNNIKKKTLLLSIGQGRLNDRPIIDEIKKMNIGTLLHKCKYHGFRHIPVPIYMKIVNNRFINWTKNLKGKSGFKRKKLIDIQDITSIEYGLNSRPVYWLIEKNNKKNLKKKKIKPNQVYNNAYKIHPCKCFTLRTRERTYDFFSNDEDVIATWVIGLGVLCYQYNKSANIQSRSEFIVKKVQLKLKLHCIKRNINYTTLWKEAIEKTKEQLSL
ncbi:hypothetical protein, conserved [Plasmodium gonderi]|uniref:PH domain-containing protein n=1 Tax=Plasmodium gonderi TaxID=77519 RepID=A0A1Y1JIH7_PLAGO|nr:hypothetical protein, conserved [Plasmodium gonderi]GAW81175.1 hypothetical protein, conserved [Plasmodium gonderi]